MHRLPRTLLQKSNFDSHKIPNPIGIPEQNRKIPNALGIPEQNHMILDPFGIPEYHKISNRFWRPQQTGQNQTSRSHSWHRVPVCTVSARGFSIIGRKMNSGRRQPTTGY